MTSGKLIGPSLERQMRDVHRQVLNAGREVSPRAVSQASRMNSRYPVYAVILNAKLDKATNFKTGAKQAKATPLQWNDATEEFEELDWELDFWNHDENKEYPFDTPGFAKFIAGHYWFFGQCKAMTERTPA